MLLDIFLIASSLFLGSTISRIVAKVLVFQKGINLFGSGSVEGIRLFSGQFAQSKSYDVLEFLLFVLISLVLFGVFYFIYRNRKYSLLQETLIGLILLIFAFIVNLATLFASYSGIQTLALIVIGYLIAIIVSFKIPAQLGKWQESKFAVANGIVTGFYLSILLHKFTASVALPLVVFAVIPIYFYIFSAKYNFLKHPGYLLLIVSSVFPYHKTFLLISGAAVALLIFLTRKKISAKLTQFLEKIYPVFILFIFLYNPTFYLGSFDSVEEGFWAGWLQRMLQGQTMYRDFAIYHPPILPAGLYVFTQFFGASLYNLRLYFHLWQIAGLVVLYGVLAKLVKTNWIRILIFVLILAYSSSVVRNNVSIRLASGLLPLLFVYWYKLRQRKVFLFLAGALAVLALLVSVETGIASILALTITVFFVSPLKKWLAGFLSMLAGGGAVILVALTLLLSSHSLNKFLEYLVFYARSFSSGYHNLVLGRPETSTLIQWIEVNGFLGSAGFLWEMSKFVLIGAVAFTLILKLKNKFGEKEALFGGIAIFGIILSRSALGRSDYFHIAFVWIVSLLLVGYLLEYLSSYPKIVPVVVLCFLLFLVGREVIQDILLQNQLLKFQSYGNPSGSYPAYKTPRAGILTGIEVKTKDTDDLVSFIDERVSKNEYIYAFPHAPEIYFLADRLNATSFDSPIIFFTSHYQKQAVEELKRNKPKLIIYNPKVSVAGISTLTLSEVDNYIQKNFVFVARFGDNLLMRPK